MSYMFCKQNGIDNKPHMCMCACGGGRGGDNFHNLMQVKKINLHFTLLKTKVSLQGFVYKLIVYNVTGYAMFYILFLTLDAYI
jgi:hypothetical protein